jgi:hypothetical protein
MSFRRGETGMILPVTAEGNFGTAQNSVAASVVLVLPEIAGRWPANACSICHLYVKI